MVRVHDGVHWCGISRPSTCGQYAGDTNCGKQTDDGSHPIKADAAKKF